MVDEQKLEEIVNCTIAKLKLSGALKNDSNSLYDKTEHALKNYNILKSAHSRDGVSEKFVEIIEKALHTIESDMYYDIIPMMYFENQSRESVADYFNTSVSTISRNKKRLVKMLSCLLFADDAVYKFFL